MGSPERDMRRRMNREPYKMLDHLLRKQVPDAMAQFGLESVGQQLRTQPKVNTEERAYLAGQALAAIAVVHAALAYRALELMDDDQKTELLENAPPLEDVMAALVRA